MDPLSGPVRDPGTSRHPVAFLDIAGVAVRPGPHPLPSWNTVRLEPPGAFRRGGDLHSGQRAGDRHPSGWRSPVYVRREPLSVPGTCVMGAALGIRGWARLALTVTPRSAAL